MAQQTEGAAKIDVKKWLNENKLGQFYDLFQEKQIDIEEIAEFSDYDIEQFAKETLKLGVLSRKRFINAINKIKQKQMVINKQLQTVKSPKRHVIISTAEQNALNSLYERFDECSKQQILIQKTLNASNEQNNDTISEYCIKTIQDINNIFDNIIKQLMNRKEELLQNIHTIHQTKQNLLQKQLNTLQTEYISLLQNGRKDYEMYVNGQNKRLNILEMVEKVLTFNGKQMATTIMVSNPNIIFDNDITMNITNEFINKLKINDCDKPFPIEMKITKVDSNVITVQYDIKKDYYSNINKPIQRICIEYALIKHDEQIWMDYKQQNNDYKSDTDIQSDYNSDSNTDHSDSDSNTDFDSDNSIQSDSNTESDSDSSSDEGNKFGTKVRKKRKKKARKKKRKKKVKIEKPKYMIRIMDFASIKHIYDDLEWITEEIKISKKEKKHDIKYKIESEIKHNKTYILRIKSLNESGWSNYSNKLCVVKTPKILIKSKILSNKEKIKLFKLVDKQTKHKFNSWKLLYVGSKDGLTSFSFFKKCHGKKNTICIINSQSDNVFGGFASIKWDQTKNVSQYKPGDKKAFIYLLRDKRNKSSKPRIWPIKKNMESAAVWYSSTATYLLFGENGYGFYMNNSNQQVSATTAQCADYGIPQYTLNGNASTEKVKEVEVFQLK